LAIFTHFQSSSKGSAVQSSPPPLISDYTELTGVSDDQYSTIAIKNGQSEDNDQSSVLLQPGGYVPVFTVVPTTTGSSSNVSLSYSLLNSSSGTTLAVSCEKFALN